jgi:hypothetical protein
MAGRTRQVAENGARTSSEDDAGSSPLLSSRATAFVLGLENEQTLRRWRVEDRGPKYIRMGRTIRYRREDVERYVKEHEHEPQHETAAPRRAS